MISLAQKHRQKGRKCRWWEKGDNNSPVTGVEVGKLYRGSGRYTGVHPNQFISLPAPGHSSSRWDLMTNFWLMDCGWKGRMLFPGLAIKQSEGTSFAMASPISHASPLYPDGASGRKGLPDDRAATRCKDPRVPSRSQRRTTQESCLIGNIHTGFFMHKK